MILSKSIYYIFSSWGNGFADMVAFRNVLYWLLVNSLGGKNRIKILNELFQNPSNTHELSKNLDIEYKTVQYHLQVLEDNNLIESAGKKYGKTYFITDKLTENKKYFDEIKLNLKKGNK
jgi:predicted transcriptional regulator